MRILFAATWLMWTGLQALAQPDTAVFEIGLEFRPRTEFRDGYRVLRSDTTGPAFFTEGRSRILLDYRRPGFAFHTAIQDVRVWGEQAPASTTGTIQVFESYVEPSLGDRLALRLGRQRIMYDNQRLFAQNDWRQNAGSHDALRLLYRDDRLEADLLGAFNQEQGAQNRFAGTDFSPGFKNYKALLVAYARYRAGEHLAVIGLHASDMYQDADSVRLHHWRHTSGGRLTYARAGHTLTLAAYYQYGHTARGQGLSAYYLQPEWQYKARLRWTLRLGAELFSGDDGLRPSAVSRSFDALYGVNHRFLGSMDYFTRFPDDPNGVGLVAPYLFLFCDLGEKLTLRADAHLFFSQNNFVLPGQATAIGRFLGFEQDLLVRFRPNSYTLLDLGYSYLLATPSMAAIKRGDLSGGRYQQWAYVMATFTPRLFRSVQILPKG
ncbi:MAG: alginate export family protein [Bacteroidia bacterium]